MATHADTINHGEYELETRGMPFETGRTSMASVCSFTPNLVSLSLSISLYPSLSLSLTHLIDDPAVTVVVGLLSYADP